jgi:uncharacterized protein (TIGR03000 family)
MYSLVLMTAMTATPDAPQFNGYFRDLFFGNCSGCSGYTAPRYSCYGGCGGSYYNGACYGRSAYPAGCSGSYYNGCNGCNGDTFMNRVRRWFDRGDCCGGWGSGYGYGCTGSRYGCSGTAAYSCFGSSAAYSCFGSPAVSYTPVFNGGQSCFGGPIPSAPPPNFDSLPNYPALPGITPEPSIPYAPPEPAPGMNPQNTGLKPAGYTGSALVSNSGTSANRATVIVRLPADARLFADARPLALTGPERKFVSPELPAGQDFSYRFRAEYERDGETVSVTKKVPVRAGSSVTVEFADLTARATPEKQEKNAGIGSGAVAAIPTSNPVTKTEIPALTPVAPVKETAPASLPSSPAMERATITVKVPNGATLFVDERRNPSTDSVRQFSTPPLPSGREFSYLLKVELIRNGQAETFTQKVPFRAGERVEVDFTAVGR